MLELLGFAMAAQFKPDRLRDAATRTGGWLYHRDQMAPPVPATQAERDGYVRWYGWMMILGFVLFFLGIIALSVGLASILPNPTDNQGIIGAIGMGVVTMGSLYFFLKWCSHAPARAFADRAPVGPALTEHDIYGEQLARFSWTKLAIFVFGMMALGLAITWDRPDTRWFAFVLPLPFAAFAIWQQWRYRRPES